MTSSEGARQQAARAGCCIDRSLVGCVAPPGLRMLFEWRTKQSKPQQRPRSTKFLVGRCAGLPVISERLDLPLIEATACCCSHCHCHCDRQSILDARVRRNVSRKQMGGGRCDGLHRQHCWWMQLQFTLQQSPTEHIVDNI